MTEQNKIIYMRTAEKDLLEIFEYISLDNPEAALHLLDKVNLQSVEVLLILH